MCWLSHPSVISWTSWSMSIAEKQALSRRQGNAPRQDEGRGRVIASSISSNNNKVLHWSTPQGADSGCGLEAIDTTRDYVMQQGSKEGHTVGIGTLPKFLCEQDAITLGEAKGPTEAERREPTCRRVPHDQTASNGGGTGYQGVLVRCSSPRQQSTLS